MRCIKNDLPTDLEAVTIEIFSDLHLGSKKCDYKAIQERVARVAENKGTYAIVLGDIMNNSTRGSVGDVYEEEASPMEQVALAVKTFLPIKDKILGVCAGNHERRSYKSEGLDLVYFMTKELGIEDKYDYAACLLFIRFGNPPSTINRGRKMFYTLYMTHGDGQGGRTVGGKANGLARRGQILDADIVVTGHTHAPLSFRESYFKVDEHNNSVKKREQLFVNASATLGYEEYAELYGMKPSSTISPKIILSGKRKEASAFL